jgi:hypothetical protein
MEDDLHQAAQSLSDERREYIASIITNSLKAEDISYGESKHLLRILGELNDIEIIWLRFFLDPLMNGDHEFREKHKKILEPVSAYYGGSIELIDKEALQNSYKEHLANLGLLQREYETETKYARTKLKTKGYSITSLGRLLLQFIDLSKNQDKCVLSASLHAQIFPPEPEQASAHSAIS